MSVTPSIRPSTDAPFQVRTRLSTSFGGGIIWTFSMFCIRGVAIACNLQQKKTVPPTRSSEPFQERFNRRRTPSEQKKKRGKETRYHTATGGTFHPTRLVKKLVTKEKNEIKGRTCFPKRAPCLVSTPFLRQRGPLADISGSYRHRQLRARC